MRYAAYFLRGGKWFLHSWGLTETDCYDTMRHIWQAEEQSGGVEGIKFEPTPDSLKKLNCRHKTK
jgi:hypothetical protein